MIRVTSMFFPSSYGIEAITPEELSRKLAAGDEVFLLDVRTPAEHAAEAIEGSHLVPIHELPRRLGELPRDREIVAYCRVGNRSAYAALWLQRAGFRVLNLEGGIAEWRERRGAEIAEESIVVHRDGARVRA